MLVDALHTTGDALNLASCWVHRRSFHFVVRDTWSIAITPDAAHRLRVEVFNGLHSVPSMTHWVLFEDRERLTEVVNFLAGEVNGDLQEVT